jgi:hypothetical protein
MRMLRKELKEKFIHELTPSDFLAFTLSDCSAFLLHFTD